jgi:anti-sigma factor RsiW
MRCEWGAQLEAYADGQLSQDELATYEQHLRDCPHCAAGVLGRLQMKHAIHSAAAARYAPPPGLRLKIQKMASPDRRRPRLLWLPQFGVAAALALLVVGAAVWLARPRPADFIAELLDLHVATLASPNPVDVVSTDRHTVKPWFEGKLPFTFNLPELQGSPFRLIGARVTYLQQNPGAHLLFGFRKHQISVFIFQDRGQLRQFAPFRPQTQKGGFTIDAWTQGGLLYSAVGDAGPADIHALRQLLQAAR